MFRKLIICISLMTFALVWSLNGDIGHASTSSTYTGIVKDSTTHSYVFETQGTGVLKISNKKNADMITPVVTSMDLSTGYVSGDTMPAGKYNILISSTSKSNTEYSIELSGLNFNSTPKTLPSSQITSPSADYTRLPKFTSTINVVGSTNAITNYIINPWLNQSFFRASGSFSQMIQLGVGINNISLYSENGSGNSVVRFKEVVSPGVKRIDGQNRYAVSANISKELFNWGLNTDTVVIARGDDYPDGLAGVPLAVDLKAPLLLTRPDALPTEIKDEIKRLGAKNAVILGGTVGVSTNIENELKNLGVNSIKRITGANRYEVAVNIANELITPTTSQAILVSGENFPDALAVSSYAASAHQPILLTRSSGLPTEVSNFLKANSHIKSVVIIGGTATISEAIESELGKLVDTHRITGQDRYEVSTNIAEFFRVSSHSVVVTSGQNFPDGLSGGVLAALKNHHIVLTRGDYLPQSTLNGLNKLYYRRGESQGIEGLDSVYILGGTNTISIDVENELRTKFIK
ncbi:cell wall-binding repeat-containing protein [Sutcliffiella horikoshii]|uniref:cell wall-binding repeat-containing protein n=1 Tax=Sutcliffiella horikoshii TaxID=79883 RepID=UPI003CF5657F